MKRGGRPVTDPVDEPVLDRIDVNIVDMLREIARAQPILRTACYEQPMTRNATLRERLALGLPDLTAEVYLYPADAGGRKSPVGLGWAVPAAARIRLRLKAGTAIRCLKAK